MDAIECAFAFATVSKEKSQTASARLRQQMQLPAPRAYHNVDHINAVLRCLIAWQGDNRSEALSAAALYHDAVYDPTRSDNEAESARFFRAEMEMAGWLSAATINEAARLIELTAGHVTAPNDTDGILLLDADLYVLGDAPGSYDAYVQAVRTEYAHVSDTAWRKGRPNVMRTFLERPRIYHGNWAGRDEREKQARANIAREIAALETLETGA